MPIGLVTAAPYWCPETFRRKPVPRRQETPERPTERRIGFAISLMAAMAASTSFGVVLGLLGTELLKEFRISRGQLGLLIGLSLVVGGLCSPVVGVLTDRLGGRKALALTFGLAGAGYLVMAGAGFYGVLLLASFVTGISNGLGNPATNKLIATEVKQGSRGFVTGTKQSGVQIGAALLGLLVPLGVIAWGWRATVVIVAGACLIFLPVTFRVTSAVAASKPTTRAEWATAFWDIWPISAFGTLLGIASSFLFLLPLYAEEALGFDRVAAGRTAALAAGCAIVGRIAWPRRAERRHAFPATLRTLAILTVLGLAGLAWSATVPLVIWPAAVVMGLSAASWNSVGMLATIVTAGPARAGAATGWVQLGFLTGSGVSTPVYGWLVDTTGSYLPGMAVAAVSAVLAAVVVTIGSSRLRSRTTRATSPASVQH
jgi:predicted MFS family arabinose efflux permease